MLARRPAIGLLFGFAFISLDARTSTSAPAGPAAVSAHRQISLHVTRLRAGHPVLPVDARCGMTPRTRKWRRNILQKAHQRIPQETDLGPAELPSEPFHWAESRSGRPILRPHLRC
jgi:hypothetical protein